MRDGITTKSGNSRYLKSVENFLSLYPNYETFANALIAGTLPVDLNGINPAGWQQLGTELNKANLMSDETESAIFGNAADRTVSQALACLQDNTDNVFRVGDLRTSIRTDLGDDWLLCNGDAIPDDYPELQNFYPVRYTSHLDEVDTAYCHAYFNGKYYRVNAGGNRPDSGSYIFVELYSKNDIRDAEWTKELDLSVDAYLGSSSTQITTTISFAQNSFYVYVGTPISNGSFASAVIDLNNISQTELTLLESQPNFIGRAYNEVTNKWYSCSLVYVDSEYKFYILECDTFIGGSATRYTINECPAINTSYARGSRGMECKNGVVFGSFYTRHGAYIYAFTDPNNIACTGTSGSSNVDYMSVAYYSDLMDTVVGVVCSGGADTVSCSMYKYDKTTNTLQVQSNAPVQEFVDIIEFEGKFFGITASSHFLYTDITKASTLIESGMLQFANANREIDYKLPNALRNSPIFIKVDCNTKDTMNYYTHHLRTITVDNAYCYIRGR